MDINSLRALIKQTLQPLGLYSADAEELLCATCAQESLLGRYRQQVGGPARGIFQEEGEDFQDLFLNYLDGRSALYTQVASLFETQPPGVSELVNNDKAAIAICRVHYERAPGALPKCTDLGGLWAYYKAHYNTPRGAATAAEFTRHYQMLVHGVAL